MGPHERGSRDHQWAPVMRRKVDLRYLLAAFLLMAPAPQALAKRKPAHAAPAPALPHLTAENHDGFGRIVFPARPGRPYEAVASNERIVVSYAGCRGAVPPEKSPRNVASISTGRGQTVITPIPGAQIRSRRVGQTFVVDLLDPPPAPSPLPAAAVVPPPPPPPVAEAQVEKAEAVAAVVAPAATLILPVQESVSPTILLRTPEAVGAAAFRLGTEMVVVLDAALAFDTAALHDDPVYGRTTTEQTQDATIIHIPLAPAASLRLAHSPQGWAVTAIPAVEALLGIAPRQVDEAGGRSRLQLPVALPSRSVTMLDHDTGSRILVGTQGSTGQGVANERAMVQVTLIPTVQGIAVSARSDDVTLQRDRESFSVILGTHAGGISLSGLEPSAAATLGSTMQSRMFDIPDLPIRALTIRLNDRIAAAAAAPALSRSRPRLRVAEAMLALGLGIEADAVLDLAAEADPALKDQPKAVALRAIGAILSGRYGEADRLADPALTGTSEITLWRGLRAAELDDADPAAARDLASAIPLLLSYPAPLREHFLPLALQTIALGGRPQTAKAVLAKLPDDPALELARGMMHEMSGEPDAALHAYALVAGRPDRLARFTAMTRAVGVQLTRGDFGPKEAADALDHALYAWRGPREELALRIHMADLRRQTGQWHEAITLLREAKAVFPDAQSQIDSEVAGIFTALFGGDAAMRMAPADFVALYDQNTDLIRGAPYSELAGTTLVNRLVALDLPGRADPVLMQMIEQATSPAKRALLGARLASVRLSANDPAAALTALANTAPPAAASPNAAQDVSADITQTRQLLYARAESQRGNGDRALAMLATLDSADADDMRANLYGARQDWKNAVGALADLERRKLPPTASPLSPEQQAIVMRQATAATLATDPATIDRLRDLRGVAMAAGPSADAFRLLTAAPVSRTQDLPRAFDEIKLAKHLPSELGNRPPP